MTDPGDDERARMRLEALVSTPDEAGRPSPPSPLLLDSDPPPPGPRGRPRGLIALGVVVLLLMALAPRFAPDALGRHLPWADALTGGAPPPGVEESPTRLLPEVRAEPVAANRYAFEMMQPDGSGPVTFDPCRPIHYVVRPRAGAPTSGALVAQAVAAISAATGLRFVDDGTTDEAPSPTRDLYQPDRYGERWAPVLIAWSDPSEEAGLRGDVAGLGQGLPRRGPDGRATFVSGTVWLDTPGLTPYLRDVRGADAVRAVITHELGHVVGADHVEEPTELMFRDHVGMTFLGAGDRHAFATLGQGRCEPGL
jgi:hypothetical protein